MPPNNEFANEAIVSEYLTSLLTDMDDQKRAVHPEYRPTELVNEADKKRNATILLSKANIVEDIPALTSTFNKDFLNDVDVNEVDSNKSTVPTDDAIDRVSNNVVATQVASTEPLLAAEQWQPLVDLLEQRFQALYFQVSGLTLAVPLTALGGIHKIDKISPLVGKPKWFMGVMVKGKQNISCVNSALWIMPEKYNDKLKSALDYQYVVMLGDSAWGLACESLESTVELTKDKIKWRAAADKRPWLAGLVKEKMCAIVDVSQLIKMLNSGLTIQ